MNAVPATRGMIQSVKESQSGKTLSVQVNGGYFTTKNWDFRDMVGQTIEFVPDVSEWQGNTIKWINDYNVPNNDGIGKVVIAGDPTMTAADAMDQAMAAGPTAPVSRPTTAINPPPQPTALAATPIHPSTYLPMTSNLVAHAIAAGLIKEPTQIRDWAKAAFFTARNLLEGTTDNPHGGSAEFDDDIPF